MQKCKVKELDQALSTDGIDNIPEEEKKDFRKLSITYLCEASGEEENCKRYSPGPSGKCSHQDFSGKLIICLTDTLPIV
jgi:hypothetical protein